MLSARITQNGIGIELIAEEADLRHIYDAVHELIALHDTLLPEINEDFLLGFAYEIRKGFEGQRGMTLLKTHSPQKHPLFHTQIVWPIFLGQVSMLTYLSKQSKQHEDLIFKLHLCAFRALNEVDPDAAYETLTWLRRVRLKPDYATLFIELVAADFILDFKKMIKRIEALPAFLDIIKPSGDFYRSYKRQLTKAAQKQGCTIYDLRDPNSRFPEDFEW